MRKRTLSLVGLLFLSAAEATAATEERDPPSTHSLLHHRRPRSRSRYRGKHSTMLAERLAALKNSSISTSQSWSNNEFVERTGQQQHQSAADDHGVASCKEPSSSITVATATLPSQFSWYGLTSVVVLFGLAALTAPTAVGPELHRTLTQVGGLQILSQAWTALATSTPTWQGLLQMAWWTYYFWGYMAGGAAWGETWLSDNHAWALLTQTVRKLLLAELWSVLWKWIEEPWHYLWQSTTTTSSSSSSKKDDPTATSTKAETPATDTPTQTTPSPSLWQSISQRVVKTLHKGGPKLVKALIRRHIKDLVQTVVSNGVAVVQETSSLFW